jgi:predicted  nucleic acid-binding Zn-ribbon protein
MIDLHTERHNRLDEKLDHFDDHLDRMETTINRTAKTVAVIEERQRGIQQKVDDVTSRQDKDEEHRLESAKQQAGKLADEVRGLRARWNGLTVVEKLLGTVSVGLGIILLVQQIWGP